MVWPRGTRWRCYLLSQFFSRKMYTYAIFFLPTYLWSINQQNFTGNIRTRNMNNKHCPCTQYIWTAFTHYLPPLFVLINEFFVAYNFICLQCWIFYDLLIGNPSKECRHRTTFICYLTELYRSKRVQTRYLVLYLLTRRRFPCYLWSQGESNELRLS